MGSFRHQRQSGFTLIELVIVIVIIGILAAVAIPKFAALSDDAKTGVAKGAAGAAASASATNFAACAGKLASSCTGITNCNGIAALVTLPAGFSITTKAIPAGTSTNCTVTDAETPVHAADFTGFATVAP